MALNPNYDAIGKAFTQQFYALFDDPAQRQQLVTLYNVRSLDFFCFMALFQRFWPFSSRTSR